MHRVSACLCHTTNTYWAALCVRNGVSQPLWPRPARSGAKIAFGLYYSSFSPIRPPFFFLNAFLCPLPLDFRAARFSFVSVVAFLFSSCRPFFFFFFFFSFFRPFFFLCFFVLCLFFPFFFFFFFFFSFLFFFFLFSCFFFFFFSFFFLFFLFCLFFIFFSFFFRLLQSLSPLLLQYGKPESITFAGRFPFFRFSLASFLWYCGGWGGGGSAARIRIFLFCSIRWSHLCL